MKIRIVKTIDHPILGELEPQLIGREAEVYKILEHSVMVKIDGEEVEVFDGEYEVIDGYFTRAEPIVIKNEEVAEFIYDRLPELTKKRVSLDDLCLILDLELEFLRSKGLITDQD